MAETLHGKAEAHSAVGKALSRWNRVEWGLSNLFSTCIRARLDPHASAAFWAVLAFEAKHKMVDATLREIFVDNSPHLPEWNKISNRLVAQNRSRNKIAHGSVLSFHWTDTAGKLQEDAALAPYFYSMKSIKELVRLQGVPLTDVRPLDRMSYQDIMRCEKAFCVTEQRLANLKERFWRLERRPKHQEQEDEPSP